MNERRARRKPGENRARLLEAGLIEFGLFGYHGASTSAIAERADVPQPHVYANFGSKKDLFVACLERIVDDPIVFRSVSVGLATVHAPTQAPRLEQQARFIFQTIAAMHSVELRDTVPQAIEVLASTYGEEALEGVAALGARLLRRHSS